MLYEHEHVRVGQARVRSEFKNYPFFEAVFVRSKEIIFHCRKTICAFIHTSALGSENVREKGFLKNFRVTRYVCVCVHVYACKCPFAHTMVCGGTSHLICLPSTLTSE